VWEEIQKRGILDLALNIRDRGLAKVISISVHDPEVVKMAAGSGVDIVMYQVSIANHLYPERNEALEVCRDLGVGVVAMKPFAGGELLKSGKKVRIPLYKTGWKTLEMRIPPSTTPVNLLGYVLDQPAVCTAVTGISSLDQLAADLAYLEASDEERDYSSVIGELT
jgi:predicted aldo/keto reductase-like oxidoreductase